MNNLQKLIKLRGLSAWDVASLIGFGYHSTQKTIKGSTYRRADGTRAIRSHREIEEAVAKLLGLTRDQAWGLESHTMLPRLIRMEIEIKATQVKNDLRKQWLSNNNVPQK